MNREFFDKLLIETKHPRIFIYYCDSVQPYIIYKREQIVQFLDFWFTNNPYYFIVEDNEEYTLLRKEHILKFTFEKKEIQ